ncbi:MAG: hypothetical protein EOP32_11960 [Rhodococcus sp. (in: high G+C Gram-positive bacteria)]|nr:MAG: hypothetical protein EOP32_11960 [Rhodococcus sp. (in: high G+C Gram-positive bacteria)]
MVKKARTPAGLGIAGKALWNSIADQVAEDGLVLDAKELRYLRDAARNADDLALIEAELEGAPLMVKGSQGQPVVNGLFAEARALRGQIAALLKQVSLEDPAEVGAGRGARTSSTQARTAALIRHHGQAR